MTYTVAIVVNPTRWKEEDAPLDETAVDIAVFLREPGNLALETYLDILGDAPYTLKEVESNMNAQQIHYLLRRNKKLRLYVPLSGGVYETLCGVPRAELEEALKTIPELSDLCNSLFE